MIAWQRQKKQTKKTATIFQPLTGLVIHHPVARSRTVFQTKTFSCTSRVIISLFVQQSPMLNAIDHTVRRGDFARKAELSFHSAEAINHFSNTSMLCALPGV